MSLETTAGLPEMAASKTATLPRRTIGQLVAISIFWFALNFHWAALPLLIVPSQVVGLLFREAPGATLAARATWINAHEGLALALVVAPGLIVALITNPFFGLLSDRTPGRLGRRRPYILGGTLLNVVGLAVMAFAPLLFITGGNGNAFPPSLIVLMLGLMLTQFSNNAAAAPFHALLPDMVPEGQRGLASGIMGLAYWLGTICGALFPALTGFNTTALENGTQSFDAFQHAIALAYVITMVVIVVMAVLTVIFVHETPWQPNAASARQQAEERGTSRTLLLTILAVIVVCGGAILLLHAIPGQSLNTDSLSILQVIGVCIAGYGAARAFHFHPRRNPDFSWVVLTRMLVMMGVYIVENFLSYYMKDVAHASNPAAATSEFIIFLTISATVSTAISGWASDKVGRKRMVYVSGSFMAVVGAAFVLAPYLLPNNVLQLALGAAFIFGLGFGAYVSVDWALVADVLPNEATFARDMGVWNIGLTLPQVFAVVFGGWLLTLGVALGNPSFGYTLLFVFFVIFCVLGTVTIRNIKGIKR
jgi:MFS family permease